MSLFSGTPVNAPSYTTSSTETPKWMQDAIYNQIQWSTNVANSPFQNYALPRVAEMSPLQQQAYEQVQSNIGAWRPRMQEAARGTSTLSDLGTAGGLAAGQQDYLRPGRAGREFEASGQMYGRAGRQDIMGAAAPYLAGAAGLDIQGAAQPYMQAAGQSSAADIGDYMNPYTQAVTEQIARSGARNLRENLLPGVSDAFVRAGQFGSSRMGEFGQRALRDTQESILREQSQAMQQGYGQALQASQADLARQAQLAGTAGQMAGQQASTLANIGQTAGQLTSQQMQNLAAMAQARAAAGVQQQQLGLGAAQTLQGAQAADYQRQLGAFQQLGDLAKMQQGLRAADVASLETAGMSQQQLQQRMLDAAYQQFQEQQLYPKQQLDWLSTQIRGMAPITPQTVTQQGYTTQFGPSPLSQLASGVLAYQGIK